MGNFDDQLAAGIYCPTISRISSRESIKKIAWLGWNQKNMLITSITSMFPNLEVSDMYDYITENKDNVRYWDINKDWDISGYDLVICFRTSYHSENSQHFSKNLKKTIDNNGKVIFDFILPEVKLMKDFSVHRRQDIEKNYGFNEEAEGYFSWLEPLWIELPEVSLPPMGEDFKMSVPLTATRFSENRTGGHNGYHMLPKFDFVYTNCFPYHLGCQYNEKYAFVASEKELLTEEQLHDHGIIIKGHSFNYCLNFIPQITYIRQKDLQPEERARVELEDTQPDDLFARNSEIYEYPNKTCTTILLFGNDD